jgi:quinolinate synthase
VDVLERGHNEIFVDAAIGERARLPIDRMLAFAAARKKRVQASGDLARDTGLFANVGAA